MLNAISMNGGLYILVITHVLNDLLRVKETYLFQCGILLRYAMWMVASFFIIVKY